MYLGIVPSNSGHHHDPSACIVDDGEILAFVEEERLTREKHAVGTFPINAVEECLDLVSTDITDVNRIGLSRNYDNRRKALPRVARRALRSESLSLPNKLWSGVVWPAKQTATMTNGSLRSLVTERLSEHFDVDSGTIPPIACLNHQLTHAASAYFPSGFDHALVLSLDNYGGHLSGAVYVGRGDELELLETFPRFNSLGRFFSDVTSFLGFRRSNGEGKVMGLAPYGEENDRIESVFDSYVDVEDGRFDTEELTYRTMGDAVSKLERDLGVQSRYYNDNFIDAHRDVAFHAQRTLERVVRALTRYYLNEVQTRNVCLAGGVALNCKMNKRVRELSGVDDIFVQPAANDAGGSLGAACELSNEAGDRIDEMTHAYLGSGYDETEVTDVLDRLKIPYESVDGVAERTATLLREGALVGWFQGRMEGGPRALGNRSILADPRTVESRDNVNKYVKHREEWRPFAPSMLKEDAERFLKGDLTKSSYFMIDTYDTTSEAHSKIPAVLHPNDDTTRPQVVTEDRNKNYYNLLQSFKLKTGVGVVLNTSFNDSGEPIVRTPREAVQDFFAMGLDVLVLGDVVVSKDVHDSLPPELDESTEESIRAQGDS